MVIARRCCNSVRSTRSRWLKKAVMGITGVVLEVRRAVLLTDYTSRHWHFLFQIQYGWGLQIFQQSSGTSKLQAPEGRHRQVRYWGPNNIRHHRTKLIAQATWRTRFVHPCIKQVAYERELQTKDEFLPRITVAAVPVRNNPAGIQKATSSVVKRARLCVEIQEVISKSNICN